MEHRLTFNDIELGLKEFHYADKPIHPIMKIKGDQFERGYYFDNACLVNDQIMAGENTIIFLFYNFAVTSDASKALEPNYTNYHEIDRLFDKISKKHVLICELNNNQR